jgi:hypothetical protein
MREFRGASVTVEVTTVPCCLGPRLRGWDGTTSCPRSHGDSEENYIFTFRLRVDTLRSVLLFVMCKKCLEWSNTEKVESVRPIFHFRNYSTDTDNIWCMGAGKLFWFMSGEI